MLMYCAGPNGVETSMMEGFQVLLKIGGFIKKNLDHSLVNPNSKLRALEISITSHFTNSDIYRCILDLNILWILNLNWFQLDYTKGKLLV